MVHRFLAELEMKLQLSSEDLEISLEECTSQVLRRIPLVMHEVTRILVSQCKRTSFSVVLYGRAATSNQDGVRSCLLITLG